MDIKSKNTKITMTNDTFEGSANSAEEKPTISQSIVLQEVVADAMLVTQVEADA